MPFELLAPRLGPAPSMVRRQPPSRAGAAASPPGAAQPPGRAPGRDLEEAALRVLLALLPGSTAPQPATLPARAELPADDAFWDGACRNVYRAFCVLYEERGGEAPRLDELRERLDASEGGASVDLIARLVIEGAGGPEEGAAATGRAAALSHADRLRASLDQLTRRSNEHRLRQLTREIHEAQRTGDEPRLLSLVEEKRVLSRAVHLREPLGEAPLAPLMPRMTS